MSALTELAERVRTAVALGSPLRIRAGGSKDFYGNVPRGDIFDPRSCAGIESYEPSELVITARAGTSLAEIESQLAACGQLLAFEPPHFAAATIGGCVAAGLAGPRRNSAGYTHGSVRDFVLGATLLDGRGRLLHFGGTVIKNVAGYDVSRLLAGSMGIFGVIAKVSLKVLPQARAEQTLRFALDETNALLKLQSWAAKPLPISASFWQNGQLHLRLSGSEAAVRQAAKSMGGELIVAASAFWSDVREQRLPWFQSDEPLWRLSLPAAADPLALQGEQCIEWGGALRWLRSSLTVDEVRSRAVQLGGHATLFRHGERSQGVFTPLSPALMCIHQRLKAEFDPARIFNPGRLYESL
jgi:glycolate oxidase FAD binding subunit